MAKIEEQLRHFAVKVNSGSGCIFQPATDQFTYILTVKHNIEKKSANGKAITLNSKAEINIFRGNLDPRIALNIQAIHVHQDYDIAIIVVDYIGAFDHELSYSRPSRKESLEVFGYPNILKAEAVKTTNLICSCNLESISNVGYEITSDTPLFSFNHAAAPNVIGFSGSGVFFIADDQLILKGIFPSLHTADGAHNKLNVFYIDSYNELAIKAGIPELIPLGLKSFVIYRDRALNNISTQLKNSVKANIDNIINSPITPYHLLEKFKGNLNVPYEETYNNIVNNPRLWKSWIDLLTFLDVVTDKPDYTLSVFLRNIRLYHSPNSIIIDQMIKEFLLDQRSMDSINNNDIIAFSGKEPSANKYLDKARVKRIVHSVYYTGSVDGGMQIDHPDDIKEFCCIDIEHFTEKIASIDPMLKPAEIKELIKLEVTKILNYGN